MSKYSDFEKEIRNPGKALLEAVERIRDEKISFDDSAAIIDEAIQEDIGMSRSDIEEYFGIYSDYFKDAYGFRPRWDYTQDYYDVIYSMMVERGNTSSNYSDYSAIEDEIEYQENLEKQYYDEAADSMKNVTLNGEEITPSKLRDMDEEALNEDYNSFHEDYNKRMEEEEARQKDIDMGNNELPFQSSHRKANVIVRRLVKQN